MYLCQYTIRGTFLSGLVLVLMSEKCRLIMFKEFENWRQFSLITSGTCPKFDQLPSQCQWTTSTQLKMLSNMFVRQPLSRTRWYWRWFLNLSCLKLLLDPSPIIGNACQWRTHSCLVNLIDVTLACEDTKSVTVCPLCWQLVKVFKALTIWQKLSKLFIAGKSC